MVAVDRVSVSQSIANAGLTLRVNSPSLDQGSINEAVQSFPPPVLWIRSGQAGVELAWLLVWTGMGLGQEVVVCGYRSFVIHTRSGAHYERVRAASGSIRQLDPGDPCRNSRKPRESQKPFKTWLLRNRHPRRSLGRSGNR